MASKHSTTGTAIPAVGLIRRSTEKQEKSLEDQRREIEQYAARHNYRILHWYVDDAISGDDTERRKGFLSMHKAACNGRDFDAILCWDQDRFGRFNSLEAGYWVHPLMQAGVRLVTVTEGPVNWNDFTGRIMFQIKQEGKHQFLIDLSRNVARRQINNAMSGYLCGQAAPYGFDRMLLDEAGSHRQRVHNGEQFTKPRSWHVTLVHSDDPEKVKWARWLFHTYSNEDIGLRALCNELNKRGIPGPGGGLWWVGTIREILRNDCYSGDFVWAKRRMGKYHTVAGGEIRPCEAMEGGKVRRNPDGLHIVKRDAFPALIDRKTFERVQAKLASRKTRTSSHKAKNGDRYVLTGLLFCGHCHQKMFGSRKSRAKGGKRYEYFQYVCSSYHTKGKHACHCHSIDESDLLALVLRMLQEALLGDDSKGRLRERIRQQLQARASAGPAEAESLRSRIAELDRDIEQGAKRLLRVPDDVADLLAREISIIRRERERLAGTLAELEQSSPGSIEAEVAAAVEKIWELGRELKRAKPSQLRELLSRMVERIELKFDHVQRGPRIECPFSFGTIDLRPDSFLSSLVSRGDWI